MKYMSTAYQVHEFHTNLSSLSVSNPTINPSDGSINPSDGSINRCLDDLHYQILRITVRSFHINDRFLKIASVDIISCLC